MKTVLLTWELGDGLGHVNRLVTLGRALDQAGCRVVFALRTATSIAVANRALPNAIAVPAPFARRDLPEGPAAKNPPACNYAGVLYNCGYFSTEALTGLVGAWQSIFQAFSPSVVVSEYSPTAVLAAAGRIPAVHLGSGWAIPPSDQPFMQLRGGTLDGLIERQNVVLEVVQKTQQATGGPIPNSVPEILGHAESFACTLRDLDPYRSVRSQEAVGPLEVLPPQSAVPGDKMLFGYLNGDYRNLSPLLLRLARAEVPANIYVRNPPVGLAHLVRGTSVKIHSYPQELISAIASCCAILHHGGLSTAETALALGRPQFLLPMHLEQSLTASSVEELGCGVNVGRQKLEPGKFIKAALENGDYVTAAKEAAARIGSRPLVDAKLRILKACLKHLN